MNKKISIAIDGPAGAGKTTIARKLADKLGYIYIDTGAMYRAVAWKAENHGIPLMDEDAIVHVAGSMEIEFSENGSQICADGVDITKAIRTPEITKLSSPVSAIPGVRRYLVALQRAMAEEGGVIMEGRDIGSVVMPNAQVKVFLTASAQERARRRHEELLAAGMNIDIGVLKKEIEERDHRDTTRKDSPLVQASGAVVIDTDGMDIDEVVERILGLYEEQGIKICSEPILDTCG